MWSNMILNKTLQVLSHNINIGDDNFIKSNSIYYLIFFLTLPFETLHPRIRLNWLRNFFFLYFWRVHWIGAYLLEQDEESIYLCMKNWFSSWGKRRENLENGMRRLGSDFLGIWGCKWKLSSTEMVFIRMAGLGKEIWIVGI